MFYSVCGVGAGICNYAIYYIGVYMLCQDYFNMQTQCIQYQDRLIC